MSQTADKPDTKAVAAYVQKWLGNPITRRAFGREQVFMVVGVDPAARQLLLGCGTWINEAGVDLWPPGANGS